MSVLFQTNRNDWSTKGWNDQQNTLPRFGICLIARRRFSGVRYNFIIRKRSRWKRFLRSHVNAMPSIFSGLRDYVLSRYMSRAQRIPPGVVGRCMREYCKTDKKNRRESDARTLPSPSDACLTTTLPFSAPNSQGLHYDGMHNARWVRRRAVCASYIAMADGRDSEKDFPNRISSPRTAYIFHDRGRANRLPLLSSIFRAPNVISRLSGSMWTNGTFRGAWIVDRGNWLENQSARCIF